MGAERETESDYAERLSEDFGCDDEAAEAALRELCKSFGPDEWDTVESIVQQLSEETECADAGSRKAFDKRFAKMSRKERQRMRKARRQN